MMYITLREQIEGEIIMGSKGTGSFGDLKGMGKPEDNMCRRNIENVALEEVARCDYYTNNKDVPPKGNDVHVQSKLQNGRIVVVNTKTNEIVGLLPSRYSYLLGCMATGYSYTGTVVFSKSSVVPQVTVSLHAQ